MWIFGHRHSKTQAKYEITARTHILLALSKASARGLTRDQVANWHAGIKAPAAANRALAFMSSMMILRRMVATLMHRYDK